MINLSGHNLENDPFPHCVIDDLFEPDTYDSLVESFPECPPGSGPAGYNIHRGDPQFDEIIGSNPVWQNVFEQCNSPAFVTAMANMFAAEIDRACLIKRDSFTFADHVETRHDKEQGTLRQPSLPAESLYVRFDFMQGRQSYTRSAHLDHRRRLGTMLLYFDEPGQGRYSGGELVLHHADQSEAKRIEPRSNRAVLFACSERSWHSVAPVQDCVAPRQFVQISVSSCHDIWPGRNEPEGGWRNRLSAFGRRLLAR